MKRSEEIRNAATEYAYDRDRIDAFRDGANWADEHPGWISVEDEMPEEDCDVLVFNEDQIMFIAHHSHDYWWSNDEWANCDNIAYWMNLPSNPQEGGSNED